MMMALLCMPRLNMSFTEMTINKTIGEAVRRLVLVLVQNQLPSRSLNVAMTNVNSFLVHFN